MEIIGKTTVAKNGQILIPKGIRDDYNINSGDVLVFLQDEKKDKIILVKISDVDVNVS